MQKLIAYEIHKNARAPIRPARRERDWIEALDKKFAYRCLPLAFANQFGWEITSTHHVRASWDGSSYPDGVRVEDLSGDGPLYCKSHFGGGVLSFLMPFLFRTPSDWNLFIRGPTNTPKDGIVGLDAIVETDWAHAPFTMNWRFTRACTVEFVVGEPVCLIFPVQRGLLNSFEAEILPLESDPDLQQKYRGWSASRDRFITGLHEQNPTTVKEGWQKDYMLAAHEKKLHIPTFNDRSLESENSSKVTLADN
jgi:hypothetical protein